MNSKELGSSLTHSHELSLSNQRFSQIFISLGEDHNKRGVIVTDIGKIRIDIDANSDLYK